jgi:hypothetical protein
MGQGCDTRPLLFTERDAIILALLLILLLGRIQCPKLVVPFRLEGIGDQPVRGVHVKVASLSQISLVPGPLDLFLAQVVHLIQSGLNLLLDGERNFQRQRGDGVDEKLADGLVNVLAEDMLAYRDDVLNSIALAHILRYDLRSSRVVANGHSAATDATDNKAL